MEPELLKIKCPNCGAVLTIKNMPELETKSIPCPVCKKTSRYTDYKTPSQARPSSDTDDATSTGDVTQLRGIKKQTIGKLENAESKQQYILTLGVNTIGRKAQSSNATVQIDTDDRCMSRIHSSIEVYKLKTGNYIHYFSNAQNKNATYVNSQLIVSGDRVILHGGETIKMANTTLKFVLESEEETII